MSSITFGSIFLFIKVASIRPLTVEATHTKTKLDILLRMCGNDLIISMCTYTIFLSWTRIRQ